MLKDPKLILAVVVIVAALAGIFVYPGTPLDSLRPWRLGLDLVGGSRLEYRVDFRDVGEAERNSVLSGLRDVIEQRVNISGAREPHVYIVKSGGESRLVVELAGVDIQKAKQEIGETPFLEFRTVTGTGTSTVFQATSLTGRHLKSVDLSRDQTTGTLEINFSLNDEGAAIFEAITRDNIGKPICVFVDDAPIIPESLTDSCPTVREEISGGNARITGNFSFERAKTLVSRFRAGALPAPIILVQEETVSATLGADLLKNMLLAGAVGTFLVAAFMIAYYRYLGIFAAAALMVYIPLTLAVFKIFGITMTLAGIAGFILTVGMAVDANILIFERMKEEVKRGLSRTGSIGEGFQRAWPSIRDSNVSTILTAIILFIFTSSFIRGFSLTLLIGVLVSMFSAITVTRTFLKVFLK